MTHRLAVWLDGEVVGHIERDRSNDIRYLPSANASLSVAAPDDLPWSPALTQNWFDGLLPEEGRRGRVAARFGLRTEDTFGLLEQIGWECAGAVAVLPEGRDPAVGTYEHVSESQLGEYLDALPSLGDVSDSEIRMSLGGVQEKLLVARLDDGWAMPIDGALTTHILKPEPERWAGLARAEDWALKVAGTVTPASEVEVSSSLGSRPVLVVKRFDRVARDGGLDRIHQEDLCQALGLPPSAKYVPTPPRDDSPSLLKLARILSERAADPPAELQTLLKQVVVSVALRNADLHAKNISLMNRGGVVSLTPLYDVLPTTAFVPEQTSIGLPIGGKFKLSEIGSEHIVREAAAWGIPEAHARAVLGDTIEALAASVETAADTHLVPEAVVNAARAGVFAVRQERPGRRTPPVRRSMAPRASRRE